MSTTFAIHLADQRRQRTDSHGIINFSIGLTRALPGALAPGERLVVLANESIAAELGNGWMRPQDTIETLPEPSGLARRLWTDHVGVLAAARAQRVDALLFPKGFLPIGPRRDRPALVPCFHDDIPAREWHDRRIDARRRFQHGYFALNLWNSMRVADRRLFVSAFSTRQLGQRMGVRSGDLVIGEGLTIERLPPEPLRNRAPRALMFGSAHRHKATAAGLAMLQELGQVPGSIEEIVVVGHVPESAGRSDAVPVTNCPGPLSGADITALLRTSRLLVFASEYEGFGLPPVEALACGTPVVYRENGVTGEVLPDVPGSFSGEADIGTFRAAVDVALAQGDQELAQLSERMWALHDWSAVSARVAAALRSVARRP